MHKFVKIQYKVFISPKTGDTYIMQYISYNFLYFVAASVLLYYVLPPKIRKYGLLVSNIVFYAFSGIKNTAFLIGFALVTYAAALLVGRTDCKAKKALFAVYIVISAGTLTFIKFANNTLGAVSKIFSVPGVTLDVIYPLGVAFFTLQGISYVADVCRGKYAPDKNVINVMLFMTYFPIIVQGPISRYDALSKDLTKEHRFDGRNFSFGLQLLLWGLFKKLVIANRAASFVDQVFNNYQDYSGLVTVFATFLYSLQLYADFSGCVDICRGVSSLYGIPLMQNFNFPYTAVSVKDFWARWHISLSTWLKDYIYIPLGGNRKGKARKYLNITAVFLVSGLWHGVGLHYIVWGLYHGALQVAGDLLKPARKKAVDVLKMRRDRFSYRFGQQALTFCAVSYGWLIFRANGLRAAYDMTRSVFVKFFCVDQLRELFDTKDFRVLMVFTAIFIIVSLWQKRYSLREKLARQDLWFRWAVYVAALFAVIIYGVYGSGYNAGDFLYMQF